MLDCIQNWLPCDVQHFLVRERYFPRVDVVDEDTTRHYIKCLLESVLNLKATESIIHIH